MLRVSGLHKRWSDGGAALSDVTFDVEPGTLTAIIGPSGSGKTTLLRVLARIESFDEGEVIGPPGRPAMVFQEPSLWPHLTLLRNVSLPLEILKGEARQAAEWKAAAVLEAWGLRTRLNAYPAALSGGEQQRGALARAVVLNPSVLCLDEITNALDPETAAEILRSLLDWKRADMMIVLATHQLGFASASADQVILIDHGQVIEAGLGNSLLIAPQHPRTRAFVQAAALR